MEPIPICYDEPSVILNQHDGRVYKRTGYCCHCGQCCIDCPMLVWITKNEIGLCGNRLRNEKQECGQDLLCWPECPENVEKCDKCTYKFQLLN